MVDESELLGAKRLHAAAEEELRYRLEEAAAAATRTNDEHRREMASASRWASQLEAKLEQTHAALALEREESGKLEADLATLRPQLALSEERLQTLLASVGTLAAGSPIAKSPGSRHAAFAIEATATPTGSTAQRGGGQLVVGSPSKPEDRVLRPAATLQSPSQSHAMPTASPTSGVSRRSNSKAAWSKKVTI